MKIKTEDRLAKNVGRELSSAYSELTEGFPKIREVSVVMFFVWFSQNGFVWQFITVLKIFQPLTEDF